MLYFLMQMECYFAYAFWTMGLTFYIYFLSGYEQCLKFNSENCCDMTLVQKNQIWNFAGILLSDENNYIVCCWEKIGKSPGSFFPIAKFYMPFSLLNNP